jgi:hypothetical protein
MWVAEVAVTNVIVRRRDLTHLASPMHLRVPLCSLWFKHFFTTENTEVHRENLPPKLFAVHGDSKLRVYWKNSAGRPVNRSILFAVGGWVENRLPKLIPPRNGAMMKRCAVDGLAISGRWRE